MTRYNPNRDDNAHVLAGLAECAGPSALDSAGADMLKSVRDHLAENVTYVQDNDGEFDADELHEIADGAPSVYTHTKWSEFTDLAAWQEDISEYGPTDDIDNAASVALYMIAERLCQALLEEWECGDED